MSTPVLKIYNTLTRTKEEFRPLDPANVRMYVCGPTVYDFAHIGNARPLIVFDVLYRLLRHLYGESHVKYVRNITDVDDKINARAAERGITIRELTEETNRVFQEDVKALGCLPPDVQPRATEHIAQMIAIIERLIAAGHAYAADGHVLFDVPSMKEYGRLSRRSLDEMLAGARVDVAPYKRGDMDFVLWKPSKESEPGWDSPWGRGRPGWHIECSAMSWAHLGETFDIHGGGIDLVFPHHENEIAQSCCAFDQPVMANYWMHNGFLQVEGEKMSKSLGNFVTIHELLNQATFGNHTWEGSVVRLAMLTAHYRQPIDWTLSRMSVADEQYRSWLSLIQDVPFKDLFGLPAEDIVDALCDDLNTPLVLQRMSQIALDAAKSDEARISLAGNMRFLGLLPVIESAAENFDLYFANVDRAQAVREAINASIVKSSSLRSDWRMLISQRSGRVSLDDVGDLERRGVSPEVIQRLMAARLAARAAKNWAESDRIRDELAAMGIALKDNKDGTTTWEVKR